MYPDIRYRNSSIKQNCGEGYFIGMTQEKFIGGLTC